jgi:type IV conjugative transfer system coupling protein TraD
MMTSEQNALNTFTRGGQYFNNLVVMAKQNFIRTFLFALIVALIGNWVVWYKVADMQDRYLVTQEVLWRGILVVAPETQKIFNVRAEDGTRTNTTLQRRMEVDHYRSDYEEMVPKAKIAVTVGFGLFVGIVLLILVISTKIGVGLGRDKHIRGASLMTVEKVRKELKRYNKRKAKQIKLKNFEPYMIAGVPYPLRAETQHTLIAGTTGVGKTQQIFKLLLQIRRRGDTVIIYDKMRSFVSALFTAGQDVILNPLDARCPSWDIFADAKTMVDWEMIAACLIPDTLSDSFWASSSRSVFANVARKVQIMVEEMATDTMTFTPKLDTVLYICTQYSIAELSEFLKGTTAARLVDPDNAKMTGSILATLEDSLKGLTYIKMPNEAYENVFSIRDWIAHRPDKEYRKTDYPDMTKKDAQAAHEKKLIGESRMIFMTSRANDHPVMQPIITMWTSLFSTALMSQERDRNRSTWFVLDELPSINRLPGLENAMAEARQFGSCYVIGIQAVSQLRDIYGPDASDTILALTRTKIVFNPGDPITAETMAKFIGQAEVHRKDHSMSVGATEIRDGQSVSNRVTQEMIIMPEELTMLQDMTAVLKFAGDFSACHISLDYISLDYRYDVPEIISTGLFGLKKRKNESVSTVPDFIEDPDAGRRSDQFYSTMSAFRQAGKPKETEKKFKKKRPQKRPMAKPNIQQSLASNGIDLASHNDDEDSYVDARANRMKQALSDAEETEVVGEGTNASSDPLKRDQGKARETEPRIDTDSSQAPSASDKTSAPILNKTHSAAVCEPSRDKSPDFGMDI